MTNPAPKFGPNAQALFIAPAGFFEYNGTYFTPSDTTEKLNYTTEHELIALLIKHKTGTVHIPHHTGTSRITFTTSPDNTIEIVSTHNAIPSLADFWRTVYNIDRDLETNERSKA